MDLASVVAALASVGVRVSGSTPNNNVQGDSSRACPTGLAGPEPSGTINDPGQHFQHSPDALLLTDFPVASLRSGRARPKAVPKLAADVQVLFDDWTDSYLADPDLAGKFAALSSGISFWRDYLPQHVISGNKLRCAGKILVPAALVPRVIAAVHSYVHGGIEKTYQLVLRRFSVPSLKLDDLYAAVKTHCDACHVCQQSKPRVGVHPDSLHYYPIPDEPSVAWRLIFWI